MIEIEIQRTETLAVKFLQVEAGVRYWEDATVNGIEDVDGTLIPFRQGDNWCPVIDLDAGRICDWPADTVASIHYKVCDAGVYTLLDANGDSVKQIDGYVPDVMCPEEGGFGDYIIMKVGPDGTIANFEVTDLEEFVR